MRIGRPLPPASAGAGPARAPAAAPFAPGAGTGAAAPARPASVGALASLDALLALQAEGGATDRRRRQLARAGRVLDRLDAVRLSLLGGGATASGLDALAQAVAEAREAVDDPELSALLEAVEARAAVELAKRERSAGA